MMDAIKEALKKHMMKHKGHGLEEGSAKEEAMESHADEKREQDSDVAPNLHGDKPGDMMSGDPMVAHMTGKPTALPPPADGGTDDLHKKIMDALMGHNSPMGRAPNTLNERANDKQKEKMASIMKHKKV